MEDDYDRVPVDTATGARNSTRFPDPEDFSNNNIILSQPSSGYKTLESQKRDSPNAYAPLTKSHKLATSGGSHRRNKKCATIRSFLLCKFVLLAIVLSMAALAVAIVSVAMMTHHIAECKGQVERLMEEFCDTMITGGQNNIGMPCGMVDNWNDSMYVCNCTAMDMNMTSYP